MKVFSFVFDVENHVYEFLPRKPPGSVLKPADDANWVWTVPHFVGSHGTFGTSLELIYFVECLML